MTNKVNIFNTGASAVRKNAVPFKVNQWLSVRGVDCHSGACLQGEER